MARRRVAVVGGGIAGLAAARRLATGPDAPVVHLLEASGRLGGRIATGPVADLEVDLAADAFITRNPAAEQLCRELGLADELVAPATSRAGVFARGRLRRLPDGLVLGVPTRPVSLARSGIVTPTGVLRVAVDLIGARRLHDSAGGEPAASELLGRHVGREVVARLADPLLGGIHAGELAHLSLAALAPPLAEAAARPSLLRALCARTANPAGEGPLFLGLRGGLERLVEAATSDLGRRGVEVRTAAPVSSVRRVGGWVLDGPGIGGGSDGAYDGVVVATPAPVAADLLEHCAPGLAGTLWRIPYAGVVLVTCILPPGAVPEPARSALAGGAPPPPGGPAGSGFLVERSGAHLVTACTFLSTKWPAAAHDGRVVLRVSLGRHGDDRALSLDDDSLVATVRAELALMLGVEATPLVVRVERHRAAFPQYEPGYLDTLTLIRQMSGDLPGLELAGAAYGGIGIPACIASGEAAAAAVLGALDGDG